MIGMHLKQMPHLEMCQHGVRAPQRRQRNHKERRHGNVQQRVKRVRTHLNTRVRAVVFDLGLGARIHECAHVLRGGGTIDVQM